MRSRGSKGGDIHSGSEGYATGPGCGSGGVVHGWVSGSGGPCRAVSVGTSRSSQPYVGRPVGAVHKVNMSSSWSGYRRRVSG